MVKTIVRYLLKDLLMADDDYMTSDELMRSLFDTEEEYLEFQKGSDARRAADMATPFEAIVSGSMGPLRWKPGHGCRSRTTTWITKRHRWLSRCQFAAARHRDSVKRKRARKAKKQLLVAMDIGLHKAKVFT